MSEGGATVVDDPTEERFVLAEDGQEAELIYEAKDNELILIHTEVPEALGGRGIGGQLVRAAIRRAEATGETVVPWCPYARKWLRDHPDAITGITIDWRDPPSEQPTGPGQAG
jgi:predicted GNAT family acetyltransferase